jgi:hypothetical protein
LNQSGGSVPVPNIARTSAGCIRNGAATGCGTRLSGISLAAPSQTYRVRTSGTTSAVPAVLFMAPAIFPATAAAAALTGSLARCA